MDTRCNCVCTCHPVRLDASCACVYTELPTARSRFLLQKLIVAQLVTSSLQIPKLPCRVRKRRPLVPVLSHMIPPVCLFIIIIIIISHGVRLIVSPLGTAATTGLLYQPQMIGNVCGAVGGMMIGRGNRSTRRKPAPKPLRPPQIPGSNPGCRGGKPATNSLSYGTDFCTLTSSD
jgi:hypothetical protein